MSQVLNLIVAVDTNTCIGKAGPVPLVWKQAEDMRRFKSRTTGNVVIMGYNTFTSIGRPLPNRINIVVTRRHLNEFDGKKNIIAAKSLESAILLAKSLGKGKEIFLIGGGMLYNEAIEKDLVKCFCITLIDTKLPEDPENVHVKFPVFHSDTWEKQNVDGTEPDDRNEFYAVYVDIRRK